VDATTAPIQSVPVPQCDWSTEIKEDFVKNNENPSVGTALLSENERVRVGEIRLKPAERIHFHRHVLDYFWTAVTAGKALSHEGDGKLVEAAYTAGQTKHSTYGVGEYKIHDLMNIGDEELIFTTVEFLHSANTSRVKYGSTLHPAVLALVPD
jgi:hypothetical protein